MAIQWIKQSWNDVKCETVQNCFRHCGVVSTDVGMDHLSGDIDPFSDLDSLQDLLVHIWPELSPQKYIEADENLASGPVFFMLVTLLIGEKIYDY